MFNDPVEKHLRLDKGHVSALKRLNISSIRDLLYHFPSRYGYSSIPTYIKDIEDKQSVTIYGKIKHLETGKTFKSRKPIAQAIIEDDTGKAKIIWFNQPYLAKMISEDSLVRIDGVARKSKQEKTTFMNPKIEVIKEIPDIKGDSLFSDGDHNIRLYPTYSETKGITSLWFYHSIQKILKTINLNELNDPIPKEILDKYHLPPLSTALVWIHGPKKENDAISARKRFAFEEVFIIQIQKARERHEAKKGKTFAINTERQILNDFIDSLPFPLTNAQEKATKQILDDMSKTEPMTRLLEGDVGSGKTAVAAIASYATARTKPNQKYNFGTVQTAYMAPTEILAKQQFESFIKNFQGSGMQIALITGSGCYKFPSKVNPQEATNISRSQLLKWVANGEITVVVGTHALIQKSVKFKNLGLVVIDEQHRFGTKQRKLLARKDDLTPHLLSMTATPIPRTLALTIYGDLDLSVLDELPANRALVETRIVLPKERDSVYEDIRERIKQGRQVFVICPRINEPDPNKAKAIYAKSAVEEAKRLKTEVFKEYKVKVVHGKMNTKEKDSAMKEFSEGKTNILVATSVVEVGVNIPNVTVMIIEGAERFGLAQLHQLRGRIARSHHQGECYLFTDSTNTKTAERLKAFLKAKDGFILAELDLQLRGSGELSGGKQWGISDIGMEAIRNIKMVEYARNEAQELIKKDPYLKNHSMLEKEISKRPPVHFE